MKKLLKEIAIITFTATLIAVVYNFFSSESLPWIYKPVQPPVVHDTELVLTTVEEANPATDTLSEAVETIDTIRAEDEFEKEKEAEIQTEPDKAEDVTTQKTESTDKNAEPSNDDEAELKTLNYEQVTKNLDNPAFIFIDARPKHEWEEDRIGNAIHIAPPYDGNVNEYFQSLMTLPKNKILVVYCSGGTCEASHKVASDLKSLGFKKVFLYAGGWDDWIKRRGQ